MFPHRDASHFQKTIQLLEAFAGNGIFYPTLCIHKTYVDGFRICCCFCKRKKKLCTQHHQSTRQILSQTNNNMYYVHIQQHIIFYPFFSEPSIYFFFSFCSSKLTNRMFTTHTHFCLQQISFSLKLCYRLSHNSCQISC